MHRFASGYSHSKIQEGKQGDKNRFWMFSERKESRQREPNAPDSEKGEQWERPESYVKQNQKKTAESNLLTKTSACQD